MTYNQSKDLMRKAVPLARKMEGDWNIRMSIALKMTVLNFYLNKALTKGNLDILLAKGCSTRRICKHYGVSRHQLNAL
ncbi:hypothetical protein HB943_05210 [Listeria weihenstephanensis]|uniref:Uncharacterized protein n=1 Tax=Listeria weihenstephanensis TaxID=1006155 RepID=A0A841Z3Y6_9LIST|nr:hypothetical protein [Listeria weihenstephanensis]MBC1499994.1 hypothetical protein [Listeria weihenstephanensis]